jgi:hypothetical protein
LEVSEASAANRSPQRRAARSRGYASIGRHPDRSPRW